MKEKFILLLVAFTLLGTIAIAFVMSILSTQNLNYHHIVYVIVSVTILISSLIICLLLIRLFIKEYKIVYSTKESFKLFKKRDLNKYNDSIDANAVIKNESSLTETQKKWREKSDDNNALYAKDSFKSDLEINDFDLDQLR